MSAEPHEDPAEELRELSAALAAHLSRSTRAGRVRLPESERAGAKRTESHKDAPQAPPEAPKQPLEVAQTPKRAPLPPEAEPSDVRFSVSALERPSDLLERRPKPSPAAPPTPAERAPAPPAAAPAPDREGADERIRRLARASESLQQLSAEVADCSACELCETRTQTVFGEGAPSARVLFVGEAPGENEDRQGRPFVGDAGQLLTDIITKGMRLRREDVYIANILKCRPPGNRDPRPLEKALCTGWLERQIELVDPEVVIPLGRHASAHLLGKEGTMGSFRGQVHQVRGRRVVPTYHPAYLLRSPGEKRACWADIQLAMAELGLSRGDQAASNRPESNPHAGER